MNGAHSALVKRLTGWYCRQRRDLPWRVPPGAPRGVRPNPYFILVSEIMLQQTQVVTVIPYFNRFMREFPTIQDLAGADEQRVLRLWQGLGYYSRGRNLRRAAQVVVERFRGQIPDDPELLRRLPGVGRYTAGAIASLGFDRPEPILDGNVARVLCRIDRIELDPREPAATRQLWRRAQTLVPKRNAGEFNSALMELGALVCTSRSAKCHSCPIRMHCEAFAAGVQDGIPPQRQSRKRPLLRRRTFCIRRKRGRNEQWLLEQRPPSGRWAGMWQFVTRPASNRKTPLGTTAEPRHIATIHHMLTHRRYRFDVYICELNHDQQSFAGYDGTFAGRWVRLADLDRYPLPRPHLKIAQILQQEARAAAGRISCPIQR